MVQPRTFMQGTSMPAKLSQNELKLKNIKTALATSHNKSNSH